jgi:hypothetical protein
MFYSEFLNNFINFDLASKAKDCVLAWAIEIVEI